MDEAINVLYGKIMSKFDERNEKITTTVNPLKNIREWCKILKLEKVNEIPIIHITGTKGKGSTSAFCQSILQNCGLKTGIFLLF